MSREAKRGCFGIKLFRVTLVKENIFYKIQTNKQTNKLRAYNKYKLTNSV